MAASSAVSGSSSGACRASSRCSAHCVARERESKNRKAAPVLAGRVSSPSSVRGSGRSTPSSSAAASRASIVSVSRSTTSTSSPSASAPANHWATIPWAARDTELTERMSSTRVSRAFGRVRSTWASASTWLNPTCPPSSITWARSACAARASSTRAVRMDPDGAWSRR